MFFNEKAGAQEPGAPASPKNTTPHAKVLQSGVSVSATSSQDTTAIPPGLIGDVCTFIYEAAPYPNRDIALDGSIAMLSGICGRALNTYINAGLNQYIMLLASTGMGKEAAASGISKALAAVTKTVPAAGEFKGPALVSSAGLLKWLDKKPSVVSVIGEFGYKLKAISSPRANPNDETLKATLLDLYGKSGAGSIVDPMALSDRDKHTDAIVAPALTLLGESVPGVVYEALDDSAVLSGLLPRFMLIEPKGDRAPLQETPALAPNPALVQSLADLCAHCLTLNNRDDVCVVPADDEAKAKFREFGQWVTDQINAHTSEIHRELWNRAHLKALKLATLCAVGINPHAPVVTINETMWATTMIVGQVLPLLARFEAGDVGHAAGDEGKQQREIMRVILDYVNAPGGRYDKYHGTPEMQRDGVITFPHVSQKCRNIAVFRHDNLGASKAIERTIKLLLEGDQLREVPRAQMIQRYGSQPRAYVVADPK